MSVARLLALARPVGPRLVLAALAGAAASACGIGLLATSAWLISRASQHPPVLSLGVAVVAVRAFGLGRGVLRYGERLAGHDAALRVLGVLRRRTYARLERLLPTDRGLSRGDLLSRFATDVDAGLDVLVRVLLPYAAALLAGGAAVAALAVVLPPAAVALAVALGGVCFGVPVVRGALARRAGVRTAPARTALTAATVELVQGLPDLVAYGQAEVRLAGLRAADDRLRAAVGRSRHAVGLGDALVVGLGGAAVWAVLVVGAGSVHSGALAGVALAVVVLTPLAVLEAFAPLPAAAAELGTARPALAQVFAVLDRPDPVPDPPRPRAVAGRSPSGAGATGRLTPRPGRPDRSPYLRVEGVSAGWDGRTILSGLSFHLPPGRRIAVVGPSGVGKTTLAWLLVRFLDPVAGRVSLDGVDLRELAGDDVRRVVGLMADDAHLFDTTIEANLRVARPDATPAQLHAALRAARLDDWVATLPHGLSTMVGEHGARVSGGQRRRLALARLLLAEHPIAVLDEPTEHLDEPTAAALTADLLDATGGRSIVLITHRPYGLDQVDEVVQLG